MPFVPVPDAALVEFRMTQDGQKIENTLWFTLAGGFDADSLETLANEMLSWWTDHYSNSIVVAVQLREIVATDMSSETGPQFTLAAPSGSLGAISGAGLPNNVSVTVSFRTANRGRSFRGRNYVVGVPASAVTENTASPSYLGSLSGSYEELLSSGSALGSEIWVVASRFSGVDGDHHPIPRAEGVTTPIISVVIVDDTVDSQRRRLPGRGA